MDVKPYRLKRYRDGDHYAYKVLDEDGAEVGTVFKYLGAWWANNAGTLDNRRWNKDDAAKLAWELRGR